MKRLFSPSKTSLTLSDQHETDAPLPTTPVRRVVKKAATSTSPLRLWNAPPPVPPRSFAQVQLPAQQRLLTRRHLDELDARGYTVVENVVGAAECERVKAAWLQTMASYGAKSFDPSDRGTWTSATLPNNTRGMHDWPPVNREPWRWQIVLQTARVFADLWGVAREEDMITSMDRVCFVPYERLRVPRTPMGWPHLDQARETRRGTLECVQGFVTLNPIGEGEVALVVYEGSHAHHAAFIDACVKPDAERLGKIKSVDWCKLTPEDRAWYMQQPGVREVRVHAPAGALVLWDSRTVHHAMPPQDAKARSTVDRFVIYACMTPRAWATDKVLAKRIKAYEAGRVTPHWPHEGKTFPLKPRTYGNPKDTLLDPEFDVQTRQVPTFDAHFSETELHLLRRLVGYVK